MFAACQRRSCFNVTIVDDEVLEREVESFTVTLERTPSLDNRITLNPVEGRIVIRDNDCRPFISTIMCLIMEISNALQWLWLVWRGRSTKSQRMWVW